MNKKTVQALLGRRLTYLNTACRVIEYLDTPQGYFLVLQDDEQRDIQPDRHGEAHRRVPRTHTVPCELKGEPNPALATLWED